MPTLRETVFPSPEGSLKRVGINAHPTENGMVRINSALCLRIHQPHCFERLRVRMICNQPDKAAAVIRTQRRARTKAVFRQPERPRRRVLPEAQAAGGFVVQNAAWQMGNQRVAGQQKCVAGGFVQCGERVRRMCLSHGEACGGGASQGGEIGVCAEPFGDVFGEGADICAFAALHVYHGVRGRKFCDFNTVDNDIARFALYRDAFAGIFVKRAALVFECGKHGRHLADVAGEGGTGSLKFGGGDVGAPCGNGFAFRIAGSGGAAELQRGGVGFVRIQKILCELGGFSEADGQQPAGEWVEHAGVAGFFGAIEAARLLQCGIAADACGLVQQQHAADAAFGRFGMGWSSSVHAFQAACGG